MSWRQNTRFIITMTLAFQAISFGKGSVQEVDRHNNGEHPDTTLQKHYTKHQLATLNVINDMNQSYESRKQMNSKPLVPFTGLTRSRTLNRHCCQNGGTCILGSFCACPKHFIGRYCEYDERKSNCGPFKHGEWMRKDCQLCRCGYGILHCLSEHITNCGEYELPTPYLDITKKIRGPFTLHNNNTVILICPWFQPMESWDLWSQQITVGPSYPLGLGSRISHLNILSDTNIVVTEEEEFIYLPSNCPRLQQTMSFLMLLLGGFFTLFCTKLIHQL